MIGQRAVSVSASVGEARVTIFGYTSKQNKVEISNPYVYATTFSDEKGYFTFDRILIPKKSTDLCLTVIDKYEQQSTPVCLPPPPASNYHTNIGPILLPPTLSLSKDKINPHQTIMSLGQAIPQSTVEIHLFKNKDNAPLAPKEVQAYSLPVLTLQADAEGNFSFNIPTVYQTNFRLFANNIYLEAASPKSNTLVYYLPTFLNYLYFILPFLVLILTLIFHWIYKKYLTKIKSWPALRNTQLLPFSSSHWPPSST